MEELILCKMCQFIIEQKTCFRVTGVCLLVDGTVNIVSHVHVYYRTERLMLCNMCLCLIERNSCFVSQMSF